jgi:hypothetical protein
MCMILCYKLNYFVCMWVVQCFRMSLHVVCADRRQGFAHSLSVASLPTIATTFPHLPVLLLAGVSAVAISLGWANTCAIVIGGGVKCWGSINDGLPADVAGNSLCSLRGIHTHSRSLLRSLPLSPSFLSLTPPPPPPPTTKKDIKKKKKKKKKK